MVWVPYWTIRDQDKPCFMVNILSCVVITRIEHAKLKVAEGGIRGWDGLPWNQSTRTEVPIVKIDSLQVFHGCKW